MTSDGLPRREALRALIGLAAAATGTTVLAQAPRAEFPTRMVRFILPVPAGSGPEVVVRAVAEKLHKRWGQPVIVEGKPGANGAIAIDAWKRGSSDGHDILLLDGAAIVLMPHLTRKLAYDPAKDFELVTSLFRTPFYVLVSAQSKHRTVADLLAAAKAQPDKLNYGSWGVGSWPHIAGSMLTTMSDTQMQHVAYKESTQMFLAVTTGELDFAFGSYATVNHMAPRMKAIAVAMPARHPGTPDVPTVAESGGPAGFDITPWTVFAVPKGVPAATLDILKHDIDAALAEPEVRALLERFGWEPLPLARQALPGIAAAEAQKYGELIKRTRISLD